MWADCERPQKAKPVCAWSLFTVTGAKGWIRAVRVLAISRRAASGKSGPFAPCSPLPRSAASRDQTVSGFSGWLARISCCLASQTDFRLIRNKSEFNGCKTGVRVVSARTSCYGFACSNIFRSRSYMGPFRSASIAATAIQCRASSPKSIARFPAMAGLRRPLPFSVDSVDCVML